MKAHIGILTIEVTDAGEIRFHNRGGVCPVDAHQGRLLTPGLEKSSWSTSL